MPIARLRPVKADTPSPSPACFRSAGQRYRVVENGTFAVGGTVFTFKNPEDMPEAGEEVVLAVGRFGFSCTTVHDMEVAEAAAASELENRRIAEAEAALARARADAVFNASLGLPFAWEPGHRVVLSGLTVRSTGNGLNRASVIHVMTTETVAIGRLHRSAGQFLCSTHVDAYGSDQIMRRASGARVTCRACLARCRTLGRPGRGS